VVRGAVAVGLEGYDSAVLHRKSRRHYGTGISDHFDLAIHDKKDMYINQYDGHVYATDQVKWLIAKGQDLHASEPTHSTKDLTCNFWPKESRKMSFELVASDEEQSPNNLKHKVDQQKTTIFIANKFKALYKVAKLTIDLGDVPKEHVETRRNNARKKNYCSIRATVNISLQSSLEFFVTVGGKKYGSVTVDYS
jgi:hypothetical protein